LSRFYFLWILLKNAPPAGVHLFAASAVGQVSMAALSGKAVISTVHPLVFFIPSSLVIHNAPITLRLLPVLFPISIRLFTCARPFTVMLRLSFSILISFPIKSAGKSLKAVMVKLLSSSNFKSFSTTSVPVMLILGAKMRTIKTG